MWSIQTVPWGYYFKRRLVLVTSRRFTYLTKNSAHSPTRSHALHYSVLVILSHPQSPIPPPCPSFFLSNAVLQLTVPALLCVLYSGSDDKNDKQGIVASSYAKPEPSRIFLVGHVKGWITFPPFKMIRHKAFRMYCLQVHQQNFGTQWTSLLDVTLVCEAKENISSTFLKYGQ
jgi:hypothetical protein